MVIQFLRAPGLFTNQIAGALFLFPWPVVGWSFLGAVILNVIITINHRRDRYIAKSQKLFRLNLNRKALHVVVGLTAPSDTDCLI